MQEVLTRGLDHLPRRLEVMAHGALNQANGVSAQLRRRQEGAGMDGIGCRKRSGSFRSGAWSAYVRWQSAGGAGAVRQLPES